MGNSLVDTSGPLVPVTLLNLDEEPKSLPRGFTVGLMEQVEGVVKGRPPLHKLSRLAQGRVRLNIYCHF